MTTKEPKTRDVAHLQALTIDGTRQAPTYVVGGEFETQRLGTVRIVAVHAMGTVDVVTRKGEFFRVSGLWVGKGEP